MQMSEESVGLCGAVPGFPPQNCALTVPQTYSSLAKQGSCLSPVLRSLWQHMWLYRSQGASLLDMCFGAASAETHEVSKNRMKPWHL